MVALNDREILILGGDGQASFEQDAYIFDTASQRMTKKLNQLSDDGNLKVSAWGNQSKKLKNGQVLALVQDESWEPFLIKYEANQNRVTRIEPDLP